MRIVIQAGFWSLVLATPVHATEWSEIRAEVRQLNQKIDTLTHEVEKTAESIREERKQRENAQRTQEESPLSLPVSSPPPLPYYSPYGERPLAISLEEGYYRRYTAIYPSGIYRSNYETSLQSVLDRARARRLQTTSYAEDYLLLQRALRKSR